MVSLRETNGASPSGSDAVGAAAVGAARERDALERDLVELSEAFRRAALASVGPGFLPPDLTMQQVRVLMLVAAESGLTSAQLAHHLGVSAPTASGLVDRLADKGLLRRTEDDADRRLRRLTLTDEAQALILELDALNTSMLERLLPLLSDSEVRALVEAHRAILRALESLRTASGCGPDHP